MHWVEKVRGSFACPIVVKFSQLLRNEYPAVLLVLLQVGNALLLCVSGRIAAIHDVVEPLFASIEQLNYLLSR